MRIPLLFALLCSPGVHLSAQTSIPYPSDLAGGTTLDVAAGDYGGNYRQGALVVRAPATPGAANALVYFCDPAFLEAVSVLPVAHPTAVVTLERPGSDRFLVSEAGGLLLGRFDQGVGFSFQPVLPTAWAGARGLRASAAQGNLFFIAAADPGGAIRTMRIDSESGVVRGEQVLGLGGAALHDLCWVDWTNDGVPELAAVGSTGVAIFRTDGTMIGSIPFNCTDASLTSVRSANGTERLAVLYENGSWMLGSGNSSLVSPSAPVDVRALPSGMVGARLCTADIDRDDDDDLLVTHAASWDALLIVNASETGQWFPGSTVATQVYSFGSPSGSSTIGAARAVSHDFDSDGYADAAHCVDADDALFLAFDLETQPQQPEGPPRPVFSVSLDKQSVVADADYVFQDGWNVRLTLESPDAGVDAFLVSVWQQFSPAAAPAPEQPLESLAFYSTVVPSLTSTPFVELTIPVDGLTQRNSPKGLWTDDRHLWVEIRSLNATDKVLATAEFIAVRIVSEPTGLPFHLPLGPYLETKKVPDVDPIPLPSRPEYVGVVLVRPNKPPPFGDSPPLDG